MEDKITKMECPPGQHSHYNARKCHDISKPHSAGSDADEWHRKHGLVTADGGKGQTGEEEPKDKEKKKPKDDGKKRDTESYESKVGTINVANAKYRDSVNDVFKKIAEKSGNENVKSPFEVAQKNIDFIRKEKEKTSKVSTFMGKMGCKVTNRTKTNRIFSSEKDGFETKFNVEKSKRESLLDTMEKCYQTSPYISESLKEFGVAVMAYNVGARACASDGSVEFNSDVLEYTDSVLRAELNSIETTKLGSSPNGVKGDTITWWFRPKGNPTFREDEWKDKWGMMRDGIKEKYANTTSDYIEHTLSHEIGHHLGYIYCSATKYYNRVKGEWEACFGDEPMPKGVPLHELQERIKKKREENGMSHYYSDDDIYYKSLSSRYAEHNLFTDEMHPILADLDKKCRAMYCELYGVNEDDLNPFDVYSAYGYYGEWVELKEGTDAPKAKQSMEYSYVHERVAEAFADVCSRGDDANSMSKIIVSYLNFEIGQMITNSEEVDFIQYLKENDPDTYDSLKDNRKVKAVRKYIVYSELLR